MNEKKEKMEEEVKKDVNQETNVEVKESVKEENTETKENVKETYNDVKENVKNIKIGEDSKAVKNIALEMFKNPVVTIEKVADKTSEYLRLGIMAIIILFVITFVDDIVQLIDYLSLEYIFENFFKYASSIIQTSIAPVLAIVALSVSAWFIFKKEDKKFTDYLSLVSIAYLPIIFGEILYLLKYMSTKSYTITTPIYFALRIVTYILIFIGTKRMNKEESIETHTTKYIKMLGCYAVIDIILSFIGISI